MLRHPVFTLIVAGGIGVALIGIGVPWPLAILIVVVGVTLLGLVKAKAFRSRASARYHPRDLEEAIDLALAEAISDHDQAIARAPQDAAAYYTRGNLRYERGDQAGAISDYSQVIALDPELTDTYFLRGLARYKQGDRAGAIDDFTRYLELAPTGALRADAQRAIIKLHLWEVIDGDDA